jgi:hypothetical protein
MNPCVIQPGIYLYGEHLRSYQQKPGKKWTRFGLAAALCAAVLVHAGSSVTAGPTPPRPIYLPFISGSNAPAVQVNYPRRVNAPFMGNDTVLSHFDEMAVFWYGSVTPDKNYTDVRIGYNDTGITVHLGIIDRLLWTDESPSATDLLNYDSASVFLNTAGPTGSTLGVKAFRFDSALSGHGEDRNQFEASYRGSGSGWTAATLPFSTITNWYGTSLDDSGNDKGWMITFEIPYVSLGMQSRPADGQIWGLGVETYNRNDQAGSTISITHWPEDLKTTIPSSWGALHYGLPVFPKSSAVQAGSTIIRQDLNGANVPDATVGGGTICGGSLDYWEQWGNTNYASETDVNIQNQANVDDYPCFSKYYITFPLNQIPVGKVILNASLSLIFFGNSSPPEASPSLIQVMTVNEDWQESTLTWNNAPLAAENLGQTWVNPVLEYPGWPGINYTWDLSLAANRAYTNGEPLRLVLYSADWSMHSGKYFRSSEAYPSIEFDPRPTLMVNWGSR